MYTFSVIIATYNRGDFLKETLNSLVNQSYKNFEVVIVDDGSTDNTESIVQQYINFLSIQYIKIANSGYPAIPRNIGAKHSISNWLCFLDSDDKWKSNKLIESIPYLDKYDVIYHKLKYFGYGKPFYRNSIPSKQLKKQAFEDLMLRGNNIALSSSLVKKEIFFSVRGFDENKAIAGLEDYDLWLKISRITNKFKFIPRILGYYRIHTTSITQFAQEQINKINLIYNSHISHLKPELRKHAATIRDYYLAVVYERMKDYHSAISHYKPSLHSKYKTQKIKSLLKITMMKLKQSL